MITVLELDSAAALLGITTLTLFKALARHQRRQKGELVQLSCTSQSANDSLSALAITLYHRCTSAIIRRANSLKTSGRAANARSCGLPGSCSSLSNVRPASGISSSDESSVHDSGIGITSQSSPNANANGVASGSSRNSSQGMDGVISVLDWFGFENGGVSHHVMLISGLYERSIDSEALLKL